jgi:hypothetical protein
MKKLMLPRIGAAGVLLFILAGCSVPSLWPLYHEQDVIFDAALLGEWREEGTRARTTIRQAGSKSYEISHRDEDEVTYKYSGHLLRLGDHAFLNLFPSMEGKRADDMGFVPVHNLYRVAVEGETLRFGGLRMTWLKDALAQKRIAVPHAVFRPPGERQDFLLLTGSTRELQDFVRQIGTIDEAFFDSKLQRRK